MIKAKLIDPFNQSVIPALISKDYKDWKKLMNIKSPIDTVRLTDTIYVIVDDEGLHKDGNRYFKLKDYPQPLAGRAIIVNTDEEGELIDLGKYNTDDIEWREESFYLEPKMEFIPL
tara:strand:- start:9123 stop:9470 length:348 start_codon:yes stop_codon:yes gene_type:complete